MKFKYTKLKWKLKIFFYIVLILGLIFFRVNKQPVIKNTTTTDTIYRTITLNQTDTLIIVNWHTPKTYKADYFKLLSKSKDTLSVLTQLIDSLKSSKEIRTYTRSYEDSLFSAELDIITQGYLIESKFKHVLKARNIKTIEV